MLRGKPVLFLSMIFASGLLLTACNTTGDTQVAKDWSDVTNRDWRLTSVMDGTRTLTPAAPIEASANFATDGKVSGSSGCNSYVGGYTQNAENLTFSPLVGTRMMCMGDAMEIEDAFNRATVRVAGWTMNNSNLVLTDTTGKAIMTFTAPKP